MPVTHSVALCVLKQSVCLVSYVYDSAPFHVTLHSLNSESTVRVLNFVLFPLLQTKSDAHSCPPNVCGNLADAARASELG